MSRVPSELVLALVIVAIVGLMLVPLSPLLLDALIALNLCVAVVILVSAILMVEGLALASFPTLLLITTLFRLALNVASTRLILLSADAGQVIAAFGQVLVRGDQIVGLVVFAIVTLIQFVVIAKGAERVAEVGARFTLDAMPGKQLAIDADLRAGALDAVAASHRRRALERESQFYGAMDGAMKFVKGDAVAGLAIIAINLVGGFGVGVGMHGLSVERSFAVYGLLAIGDGLASQIPSLVISSAAALVVTRVAAETEGRSLGPEIATQFFREPRPLGVAAAFALLLGVLPGLPTLPFICLAAGLGLAAYGVWRRQRTVASVDGPLAVHLGAELFARVGAAPGLAKARLLAVARRARERFGVRVRPIAFRDDRSLGPMAFAVRLHGASRHRGEVASRADRERALSQVVGAVEAAIAARPDAWFTLEDLRHELDELARVAPEFVRAAVPARVTPVALHRLLRALLREGVSIRPLTVVLDAVLDAPDVTPAALLAHTRAALGPTMTDAWLNEEGRLPAYVVDPLVEDWLREHLDDDGGAVALDPGLASEVVTAARRLDPGRWVLLTQADVRPALRQLVAEVRPGMQVWSYREVDPRVEVHRLGVLSPGGGARPASSPNP